MSFLPSSEEPTQEHFTHGCPIKKGCICDIESLKAQPAGQVKAQFRKENRIKLQMFKLWRKIADAVWVICLKDRDDRLQESAEQLHMSGLCKLAQYYRPVRPTEDECATANIKSRGRYGCWNSHQVVAQFGMANPKAQRVMVFEDDLQFHSDVLSVLTLRTMLHDLRRHVPKEWDVFKLGQLTFWSYPIPTPCKSSLWSWPRLWRTDSGCTHAMIWSRRGMEIMANTSFSTYKEMNGGDETDVDLWMRKEFKAYSCYPQLVRQSESPTSNIGNFGSGSIAKHMDALYRQKLIPTVLNQQGKHHRVFDVMAFFIFPLVCLGLFLIGLVWLTQASKWSIEKLAATYWPHETLDTFLNAKANIYNSSSASTSLVDPTIPIVAKPQEAVPG